MITEEQEALAETAALLGTLLLREIDERTLAALRDDGLRRHLEALGVDVPAAGPAVFEELAAEFFERFVSPERWQPLVQSLYQGAQYEGAPAASLRALADTAGVDFASEAARGAPVDHLGCILLLWAELLPRWPEGARTIVAQHLDWALRPLRRHEAEPGFYGPLCGLAADFIELLRTLPTT